MFGECTLTDPENANPARGGEGGFATLRAGQFVRRSNSGAGSNQRAPVGASLCDLSRHRGHPEPTPGQGGFVSRSPVHGGPVQTISAVARLATEAPSPGPPRNRAPKNLRQGLA